jgi:hypothetical protein
MTGEVIHGPGQDILTPAELAEFRPGGFMVRFGQSDEVFVDILASIDQPPQHSVIARLAFTFEGFQQFVEGLSAIRNDLIPGIGRSDPR